MTNKALSTALAALAACLAVATCAAAPAEPREWSGHFIANPASLTYLADLGPTAPVTGASPWTMLAWVRVDAVPKPNTLIAGFGDGNDMPPNTNGRERFFIVGPNGTLGFWGCRADLTSATPIAVGRWQMLAATYDGYELRLLIDGQPVAHGKVTFADARAEAQLTPKTSQTRPAFTGDIARFRVLPGAMADAEVKALLAERAGVEAMALPTSPGGHQLDGEKPSKGGHIGAQARDTLPTSVTPVAQPARKPKRPPQPPAVLSPSSPLILRNGWEMIEAPRTTASVAAMSAVGFNSHDWYDPTVPGTALTTLVDQGVYPDATFGLNNTAIPESLCHQDYWYRTTFTAPQADGHRTWVRFDGINYASEIWLNNKRLGTTTGAFIRGTFDVTDAMNPSGPNVLLVRVAPPPHPGVPTEKSLKGGVGPNGGQLCRDGPTFICTEGWDWIPAIRDRDTGIWQDVTVSRTGPVVLVDPQVTTALPLLPDTSRADVTLRATVRNASAEPQRAVVSGDVAGLHVEQAVDLAAGESRTVAFAPLALDHPRLWWPNGYGRPELYSMHLQCTVRGMPSDRQDVRFGVRQVEFKLAPQLTFVVNGHPIMVKGGNWGMDDALKRCARDRLEPYVRLNRDANLNLIRNWTGESTEQAFFDLCDEYGMLVWNDFWQSSVNVNLQPADPTLFLANARDVILRFRNHPCIALWCGRNEGTPAEPINRGLADLVRSLDGGRRYQPSSIHGDLMNSGPWSYADPAWYYGYGKGFDTELGVPSVPTAESISAMMPPSDRWPFSDAWAYHDFHPKVRCASYLSAIDAQLGPSTSLVDFDRKAQVVNYASHRAMFEGWQSKLFAPNSGVILWMSHPAWPSTVWQLYASDGDPHAAFFAVRKACEPVHVQLNLATADVEVINHTFAPLTAVTVTADAYGLDGRRRSTQTATLDAAASRCTSAFKLAWPAGEKVHLVKLTMKASSGELLSDNVYWHADMDKDLRRLNDLPAVDLRTSAVTAGTVTTVTLENPTDHVALMAHVSLRDAATGDRVLPVYYDDNYVTLLPHETRTLRADASRAGSFAVHVDGYNVTERTIPAASGH